MKDEEKKVNEAEEVQTEEEGVELTDEELAQVAGGSNPIPGAEFVNLGYDGLNQKDIELQVEMKRKYNAEPVAYDFR